jgi:diguanylate cyclase (GGDEF)-like protein
MNPCGSFIVDHRGRVLGFDQAMEHLTGWPATDVVGRDKDVVGTGQGVPLYDGELVPWGAGRAELALYCRDGRTLEVEASTEPLRGGSRQTLVTIQRIIALSTHGMLRGPDRSDPLTRLPGSCAFRAALEADFLAASETVRPLAVVLADVDRLRRINDALGHSAGDAVLAKLAGILRASFPDEKRVFRLGDDDFAILMPGAGRGDARRAAAALRSTVERHSFFASDTPRITLSLGASSFPGDADSAPDLLQRAREALDEARTMGRNRVWCFVRRPRVPVQVPVYFDGADSPLVGYTRDLSPSGIFVQTSAAIEIGMRCALAFALPGQENRVHVIGRVVRRVPPEVAAGAELRITGMGFEFERFGGRGDRRAIDAFLHQNEARTLRAEGLRFSV